MKVDTKLGLTGFSQLLLATAILVSALTLGEGLVSNYRLWELFPVLLASSITTLGIKEMRRNT